MATEKVVIPDFGDVQEITVVEVYVNAGDRVEVEDALIALESEKAVMDIPSPLAGVVKEVYLKDESVVKSGDAILLLELDGDAEDSNDDDKDERSDEAEKEKKAENVVEVKDKSPSDDEALQTEAEPQRAAEDSDSGQKKETEAGSYHATPSVRAYARELGVELVQLVGTGPKGRIVKEDVQNFVKKAVKGGAGAADIPSGEGIFQQEPLEDFSKYGKTEETALGRIKKISGPHLHKSWVTVPHVTHFDEADVTDLEQFRKQMNEEAAKEDIRYSSLVFIIKAVVATLKEFPIVNSSLVPGEAKLILKHYYNIGIAVDTPNGLVVPVIKDADKKGMRETAVELKKLSQAARDGKLAIADMQGASFTISSLGGIGGTGFTPIVNAPQVAILGLSRNYRKPVWNEDTQAFKPRMTLPFSLSYDHRVIDGADAARFCRALSRSIEDLRRALL